MLGAQVVSGAFFATAAIFGGLAFYAHRSQRDFSFLGGFLFAGTIGLSVDECIGNVPAFWIGHEPGLVDDRNSDFQRLGAV